MTRRAGIAVAALLLAAVVRADPQSSGSGQPASSQPSPSQTWGGPVSGGGSAMAPLPSGAAGAPSSMSGALYSCSSGMSAADARAQVDQAQSALGSAAGFKEQSRALDQLTRAQAAYSQALACQNQGRGYDPTKFVGSLPDPTSRSRVAPTTPVTGAIAPPEYSAFQGQDSPPPAGISYTPPAGFANGTRRGRWKKRRTAADEPAPGAPPEAPAAPAAPAPAKAAPQTIALSMTTRKDSQGHELVANPFVAPKGEPSRWVSSGLRRIELGDFLGALMDAERALEAAPGDADAHRVKAQALSALGRFEEARAAALDAVALAPQSAAAYEVLAWALANLGDYAGAARAATRALELDPKDAFAYAIRAFARQKLGDRDGAAADAREAALRNPAYQAQAAAAAAGRPLNPPPLASLAPAAASAPRPSAGEPEPVSSAPPVWPALVAGGLILLMLGGIGFAVVFRRGSVTTP